MLKIAVLHPGSRQAYAIPVILSKNDLLFKAYTDWFFPHEVVKQLIDIFEVCKFKNISKMLQSRTSYELNANSFRSCYLAGLQCSLANRRSELLYKKLSSNIELVNQISQIMLRDSQHFNTIYAFLTSGLECFDIMPDKVKILDIMHPPHKFLIPYLREEYQKFSEWAKIEDPYNDGSEELLIEREQKELERANIITTPSEFVMSVVQKILPDKISNIYLNPYSIPLWVNNYVSGNNELRKKELVQGEPLKILFAGTVNLRKGIQYLLPALRLLKGLNIEVKIVGRIEILKKRLAEYEDICEFTGSLSKRDLAREYKWANLFVFPSVAEGSAGVIYEAMRFGLPVITTSASGSVVRDSLDGFVLQQPSVEAIAEKIITFYNNRELLQEMSVNACNRVNEFSLENSKLRFLNLLNSACSKVA